MKLLRIFFIFKVIGIVKSEIVTGLSTSSSDLSQAVVEIINNFYAHKGSYFHIVKAVQASQNYECNEIISSVLRNVANSNLTTIIETNKERHKVVNNRKRSSVFLFTDSLESFRNFYKMFSSLHFKIRRFFTVVVIDKVDRLELEIILNSFWTISIRNVNVIMRNDDGVIDLFTFLPFNKEKCGDTRPIAINRFDKNLNKWKSTFFFSKKIGNLHQCPFIIGCSVGSGAPSIMSRNSSAENVEIYGIEKDIWDEFSRLFNFQPIYEIHGQFPGLLYENGTATG